jgi:hypothetical protein
MKNDRSEKPELKPEIVEKIINDDDFVHCPKLDNSLKKVLEKNPDGLEDNKIAEMLGMTLDDVEKNYQSAVNKIRQKLNIKV